MKKNKISFIIPTRNNLNYLKLAYNSIRKNNGSEHELVLLDDASTDGTWTWLQEISKRDKNIIIHRNEGPDRLGHTILYDVGVKLSTNDIICIGHSDMYYGPRFVENLLKFYTPKCVVSGTRIEPPLHPQGVEKIQKDFGININDFNESECLSFMNEQIDINKNKTTQGFFAPWLISKEDFNEVGGHDPLYSPQSREDSDIANRFYLNNYELIQSWSSFVYHLTCRGSRFKDKIGSDSKEWQLTNYKGELNFFRKWGSMVQHDEYLLPIISNKYQIRIILDLIDAIDPNSLYELLRIVEPRVAQIILFDTKGIYYEQVVSYKGSEQEITLYDMNERILYNIDPSVLKLDSFDVEIYSTPMILSKDKGIFIQLINKVLDTIDEPGIYEYENNKIKINRIKRDYYLDNIVLDKEK